jgi:hypothetical protein
MARSYQVVASPVLIATRLLFGVREALLPLPREQERGYKLPEIKSAPPVVVVRRSILRGGNAPPHYLRVARNRCNTPTSGSQRGTNRPRTRRDRQGMHVLRTR